MSRIAQWQKKYGPQLQSTTELGKVKLKEPIYFRDSGSFIHYLGFSDIGLGVNRFHHSDFSEVIAAIDKLCPDKVVGAEADTFAVCNFTESKLINAEEPTDVEEEHE